MKLRAVVVLAPLLLGPAASATFSGLARADTALEEARALAGKATVEYNLGRFQEALDLYTKAYERLSKPALLFNIGQCHRLLGHYEQALFFYHGYLREQPEAPNRGLVEQHIEEAQKALDAQRAAQESQRQAPQATDAHAAAPAAPVATASTAAASPGVQAPPSTEAPAAAHPPPPWLRIAGLATAGVGVVLLGTGVAFGVHANALSGELSQVSTQHGTWTAEYQSDYNSGKSAASAATALYVVGALAVAGGGVMTYLGWPRRTQVTASVAPLPGGGAMGMAGTF